MAQIMRPEEWFKNKISELQKLGLHINQSLEMIDRIINDYDTVMSSDSKQAVLKPEYIF